MKAPFRLLFLFFLLSLLSMPACISQLDKANQQFQQLKDDFLKQYPKLEIPQIGLSYVQNLEQIQPLEQLERQSQFFTNLQEQLQQIDAQYLEGMAKLEYGTLVFECQLHQERLALEKNYRENDDEQPIDQNGIYFNLNGKQWYAYFIKRWLGADISPEDLLALGEEEVREVQESILAIQKELNYEKDSIAFYEHLNSKRFFEPNKKEVLAGFLERKKRVREKLWEQFYPWDVPDETIARGTDDNLSHVPGYYRSRELTFYFNLFDQPYNIRQYDWLYLHEAVPGHHFQIALVNAQADSISPLLSSFYYPGYGEGWAAYVEEIGETLGLYQNPYDWMGKHEWNIVRSVRVVLDVGINYLGWSNEKALSYWKTNIANQDAIAMREIRRMQRWPGQVHTYKYGARQILNYKKAIQEQQGEAFKVADFHQKILQQGGMPWTVLEQYMLPD
ncbi:MAG: DUF885 domain-containing protein [Bacteroidota bacterium]